MLTPKFCRIAIVVDDMASFTRDVGRLLGIEFVRPKLDELFEGFTVMFGEHGLEPIALETDMPFARDGRLIEIAVDVASAERTKAAFEASGYKPIVANYLPAPGATEYLFGRDFHGLPVMICTAGDNETQMREQGDFLALEDAPLPKIGCVSVFVDDLEKASQDFERLIDMHFVPTEAAGLGTRAVVGPHRVKLVESGSSEQAKKLERPLAAIEFAYDDVEPVRQRLVEAGYPVLHERPLQTGGKAYYFGATVQGMPIGVYPISAEREILGLQD
ncbi:MAG: VOC family protein [Janthinobacterium lividum]